jgi:hypothetical protein
VDLAGRLNIIQHSTETVDARFLSTDHATVFTNNSGLVKVKSNNHLLLSVDGLGDIIWCSPHADIKIGGTGKYIPSNIIYYCE